MILVLIGIEVYHMKRSKIMEMSLKFSFSAIKLYRELINKKEYIISKQLLRSATSIGANVFEASAASSRKDFINKMTIASKEARESYYWLILLSEGKLVEVQVEDQMKDISSIINILTAIVKTTKDNLELKE